MIPSHEAEKAQSYAYVAGCRNAAWLVGRVQKIDTENRVIYLTRSGEDAMIPLSLEGGDRIPGDVVEGSVIKVILHVYSGIREEAPEDVKAGRHVRLIIKSIDRPTLLDMRPAESFLKADLNDLDVFSSYNLPDAFAPNSNSVELAGFVDGSPITVRDQDHEKDRLVFTLRQAVGARHLIPIEITGKRAPQYRRVVMVGQPVLVSGSIYAGRRHDTGESVGVVRCTHVRTAVPEQDFKFDAVPDWAIEIRRRWALHVQQERERLAALAAARQAEALMAG